MYLFGNWCRQRTNSWLVQERLLSVLVFLGWPWMKYKAQYTLPPMLEYYKPHSLSVVCLTLLFVLSYITWLIYFTVSELKLHNLEADELIETQFIEFPTSWGKNVTHTHTSHDDHEDTWNNVQETSYST